MFRFFQSFKFRNFYKKETTINLEIFILKKAINLDFFKTINLEIFIF